ncbi:MAG: glycosyltransferase [Anaerolineales bacterium]|nr:glycosyltransferase [Anaerolineales bacterium]
MYFETLFILVAIIYFLVIATLFLYGLNFYYLAFHAWKGRRALLAQPPSVEIKALPAVTVQLPIFNEWYVAERLIRAAAALEYPPPLLEIQVLDDSTDETFPLVTKIVRELQAQGCNIRHLHRTERKGYKAGALAEGLKTAQGEFIAIFDADFIPPPDFLKKILPCFDNDRVAFVQARWGHLNRGYSLLTFLQSLSIDAHFAVEQLARSSLDLWFNFNGTAGVWRKAAILDAGGWKAETLTEDLDLSYRAFLRGWSARYAGNIEVQAELPVSFTAFRRQQHRWARGSFECAIRYVPIIWNSDAPLSRKIQSSLHLTGYGIHLMMLMMSILYPILLLFSRQYPSLLQLFGIAYLFNVTAFAPTVYFAVAQSALGKRWFLFLPFLLLTSVLGAGMMVNTLRAALQVWFGRNSAFERTPKYGITQRRQTWDTRRYFVNVDALVVVELLFAAFNLWTVWLAWQNSNWLIMTYALLFALGLFFTSGFTISQTIRHRFFPAPEPDPA